MLTPRTFWISLAVVTVLRIFVAAVVPLTLDEPYYWMWARHPAMGYYDHPPLMAWMSSPFALLGDAPLLVRAPALIAATLCAILIFTYARHLTRDDAAATACGLALLIAPYYSVMAILAWPEPALLLAWAWTLLAWHIALFEKPDLPAWVHAGVALGCCLLAKFTSFALPAGLALFFLLSPRARRRLGTPGPWVALMVAAALYSPFLYWNSQHAWVTFLFQAAARRQHELLWGHIPSFLGETLIGLSPLIAVALVPAVRQAIARAFRDADGEPWRLPVAVSLPPLLGFYLLVPISIVQVYWTLCCYLGLFPLLGAWYAARTAGRITRVAWVAAALGLFPLLVAIVAVAVPQTMFRLADPPHLDGVRARGGGLTEMYGWDSAAAQLEEAQARMPHPERTFIAAEDHRMASHLWLRLPPPVLMLTSDRRGLQYLQYMDADSLAGWDCVLLLRQPFEIDRLDLKRLLGEAFDRLEPDAAPLQATWNGLPAQDFFVVRCYGFHPERAGGLLHR